MIQKPAPKESEILRDRRRAFTLLYALSAWAQAEALIKILAGLKVPLRSREYAALCNAIATFYLRPFTISRYGQPLGEEMVPEEFKALHADLKDIRHKSAAHTDGSPLPGPTGRPKNAIFLHQYLEGARLKRSYSSARYTLNEAALAKVSLLMIELSKKADYHGKKIFAKYHRAWPPAVEGEFMLNVENDTGPMWIKMESPPDLLSDQGSTSVPGDD
jgi:hypothetical protein